MYFKIIISILLVALFSGCANYDQTLTLPKDYKRKNISNVPKSSSSKESYTGFYPAKYISQDRFHQVNHNGYINDFKGNGYIKGFIEKVFYSKKRGGWVYYIKGVDFSNGKLRYAKVLSYKKVANLKDLVYAIIKNGEIVSIYIYKKSQIYSKYKKRSLLPKIKKRKRKYKKYRKTPKKRQRVQLIDAPKEEMITF